MPGNPHIIGKQFLEIRQRSRQDAFARQQEILKLFKTRLLPEIEAIFDRYAGPDVVIRLDRLDLDLGSIPFDRLESEWVARLREQLPRVLEEYIPVVQGITSGRKEVPQSLSGLPEYGSDLATGQKIIRLTSQASTWDAWMYFLRRGTLPWWFPASRVGQWEEELLAAIQAPAASESLRALLQDQGRAKTRLLRQTSQKLLFHIFQLLQPERSVVPAQVFEEMWHWLEKTRGKDSWREEERFLLNATTLSLVLSKEVREEATLLLAWIAALPDRAGAAEVYQALEEVWGKEKGKKEIGKAPVWQRKLWEALTYFPGLKQDPEAKGEDRTAPGGFPIPPVGEQEAFETGKREQSGLEEGFPEKRRTEEDKNRLLREKEEMLEEGLYLPNAGLVLLHPFLEAYFEQTGLLDGKAFRSPEAHARAVLLTQYLVSGTGDLPEYDLPLNKLLCGFAWEEPLPRTFEPTEEEESVTEELLKAAIGYWKALKSSSPDALREGFLQRAGKLSRDGRGLRLQVEQSGIDVLLGSLPWGIGIVRTPWMEEMLYVDWA